MANILDIIQRIAIEGDKAIVASFNKIADAGGSAFEAIAAGAQRAAAPLRGFQANIDDVEKKANNFGRALAQGGSAVGTFVSRVSIAGAGLAAVGGKVISSTLGISTALKSLQASLVEQRLAASQNAGEAKKHIQTDFSQQNALEDLRLEYTHGKLSIEEYSKAQQELQRTQERARRQQIQLEIEQEDIRKQQAKDTAAAQQRAVVIKLEAQYGGALAAVLVNLANVLDTVRNRFLSTFGPQVAQFLTSVVTAISNAAPLIFAQFDAVSKAIQASFKTSGTTIQDVVNNIVKFLGDAAKVVVTVVIPAFQLFLGVLQTIATAINGLFGTNFSAASLLAFGVVLKLVGGFGLLRAALALVVQGVALLFAAFGPIGIVIAIIIALILTQLIPALAAIDWAAVAAKAKAVWDTIVATVTGAFQAVKDAWAATTKFFQDKIDALIGFFSNLIAKVKEFLGLTGNSNQLGQDAGLSDIGGKAGGGHIRGRGTGTSDSILARLSNGEYVIKAAAVRKWGVGFMNSINNMRNPLRGFAAGGLVAPMMMPAPAMAFASGGPVRPPQGRPLVLQIGDQQFDGLTVQDDTANNMARYAARRGIRSAGRRPLWFGGGR